MNTPITDEAIHIWVCILAGIKADSPMTWTVLQPSRVISLHGSVLTVGIPEDAIALLDNQKMYAHLHDAAIDAGFPSILVAFQCLDEGPKAAPAPPAAPSYYLVTDACTGEHLGFPSISLIEAHLKLASIGPEWPAVALLAHRMGDRGATALWLPGERGPVSFEWKAVKLLQVGKE